MLLLQVQPPDSTGHFISKMVEVSETTAINPELWDSFIIPLSLLIFFSLIKYGQGVALKEIKWYDFAAEMAIDLLSIFGAYIVGRYLLVTSSSIVLLSSVGKVVILMFLAVVISLLRRLVHIFMDKSHPQYWGTGGILLLEYAIDVFCIILIFKI